MKYVLCFMVVAYQTVTSSAQQLDTRQIALAIAKIEPAISKHPEPLVRDKLIRWIETGKVRFAATNLFFTVAVSCEEIANKKQVLLWYNPAYVTSIPEAKTADDKETALLLVLYHEAVHLEDHFSGRIVLGPLVVVGPRSMDSLTNELWDSEWSAVSKEWELAKKLQKPHLVPAIYVSTRRGENPRTFLQGFYWLQMHGVAVQLNHDLAAGFTSRYRKELAKLH